MFGALGRMMAVAAGFLIGAMIAALVAFRLSIERFSGSLHSAQDPSGTVIVWVGHGLDLPFFVAVLIAVFAVIIGEVARIRSLLYYMAAGGIALAAAPLWSEVHRAGASDGLPAFIWQVFATAGFVGGATYWLIAGRRA